MPRLPVGVDGAHVAHAAAAERLRIGVEHLIPSAGEWQAKAVAQAWHGSHVRNADERPALVIPADPREDIGRRIVGIDPLETTGIVVALPEGWRLAVDAVDIAKGALHALMLGVFEQPPLQALVGVPLGRLAELPAHEEQLAPGMRPHEAQVGAQIGQLLPTVAGHLAEQRALAVDHLVMRQRQHEVLAVGVHHREGHLVVVVLPMDRFALHVAQGVVHPAHVPLQAEPETAEIGRAGHARPRRRLLGHGDDPGSALVDGGVHLLQEGDGVEVLPAAVLVGTPLPGLAGVVEVEHRCDRIDAQAIDVVLLAPVHGVRDEEVADLGAPEVEDERAPVRMLTALRVGMLVERRAVEAPEGPGVLGEVGGHPVDEHADARLVQGVDEEAQVVRRPEARGGSEVGRDLVAPGPAEGVLCHREELHVGKALLDHVGGELGRELPVVEARPPGSEMHFVDRHRRLELIRGGAGDKPVGVVPCVITGEHDRAGGRRHLGGECEGVGLLAPDAVAAEDGELVDGAVADARDEDLPDTGRAEAAHRMRLAIPVVETAGHAHAHRVGCPDGE